MQISLGHAAGHHDGPRPRSSSSATARGSSSSAGVSRRHAEREARPAAAADERDRRHRLRPEIDLARRRALRLTAGRQVPGHGQHGDARELGRRRGSSRCRSAGSTRRSSRRRPFPRSSGWRSRFSNSTDFRLRAEQYFAITVEHVAVRREGRALSRAPAGFAIAGLLGYDVLIQFDPFAFVADFQASVQLTYHSKNLFKVSRRRRAVRAAPAAHAGQGDVRDLLVRHLGARSTRRSSPASGPAGLPPVERHRPAGRRPQRPAQLGRPALRRRPRSWSRCASRRRPTTIRLHPLGRLSVKQTVVPLELDIAKFGNATPADAQPLRHRRRHDERRRRAVRPGDRTSSRRRSSSSSSDDEKLTRAVVRADGRRHQHRRGSGPRSPANDDDILEDDAIAFETILIDGEAPTGDRRRRRRSTDEFVTRYLLARRGADEHAAPHAASAVPRRASARTTLAGRRWTIASRDDGSAQDGPGVAAGRDVSYRRSVPGAHDAPKQRTRRGRRVADAACRDAAARVEVTGARHDARRITSSCRGCSRARSRTFPISSPSVCADDQPAVAHGARRRHVNSSAGRASRVRLLRSGRRHRHRSAAGRPARAAARHRRLRAELLPVVEFDRPDFPWLFSPAKADAQGRLRPWLVPGRVARSRAWSCGPPAARRCRCSTSSRRPGPATSCPTWPSRISGRTRRSTGVGAGRELEHGSIADPATQRVAAAVRRAGSSRHRVPRLRGSGVRGRPRGRPGRADRRRRRAAAGVAVGRATRRADVELPVYYSWEFRTGRRRRLRGAGAPARAARAAGRTSASGRWTSAIPASPSSRSPTRRAGHDARPRRRAAGRRTREPDAWPDETRVPFQAALAAILNTPWRLATTAAGRRSDRRAADLRRLARRRARGDPGRRRRRRRRRGSTSSISIRAIASSRRWAPQVVQAEQEALMAVGLGAARRDRGDQPAAAPGAAQSRRQRALPHQGLRQLLTRRVRCVVVSPARSRFDGCRDRRRPPARHAVRAATGAVVRAAGDRGTGGCASCAARAARSTAAHPRRQRRAPGRSSRSSPARASPARLRDRIRDQRAVARSTSMTVGGDPARIDSSRASSG